MRTLTCAVVVLACVGLTLLGCTDKSQSVVAPTDQVGLVQDQGTLAKVSPPAYFTGTDYYGTVSDWGKSWVAGVRLIEKGVVFEDRWETDNARVTGDATITLKGSLDANGEGPIQGKFTVTPDVGGGMWEGSLEGKMALTGDPSDPLTGTFYLVAQGKGGSIDGMKLSCTELFHENTYNSDLKGYIQSH
jgi:hypothetical protein